MSFIVRSLTCVYCNYKFDNLYISFGHPDKSFDWKWLCDACKKENTKKILSKWNLPTLDLIKMKKR